jgi:predicted DNA-binding transcriptional regulator AlpA
MNTGAVSILHFCRTHGISRATFYNLRKRGEAPIVMKVGKRTLVSLEAAESWRRRMENLPGAQPNRAGGRP